MSCDWCDYICETKISLKKHKLPKIRICSSEISAIVIEALNIISKNIKQPYMRNTSVSNSKGNLLRNLLYRFTFQTSIWARRLNANSDRSTSD